MRKPIRTGNIDCFCSKLGQSSLKGLLKIPCEHRCHTKYGSGQGLVRKGHEWSPNSKFIFTQACGTCFVVNFASRIHKSRPFCNLTYWKSATEKIQVNPGSHKIKFSHWHFLKKICVYEPDWSQDAKNAIFGIFMSRNAPNRSLKMTSSTDTVFGLYLCQKKY